MSNLSKIADLKENNLIKAFLITATILAAVSGVYASLDTFFGFTKLHSEYFVHAIYISIIIYLCALILLMFRNSSRPLAGLKNFTFDGSELWHGNEVSIAYRAVTFNLFLAKITSSIGKEKAEVIFFEAGKIAGVNFGEKFGTQIYPTELRGNGPLFSKLTLHERIKLWAEYDTTTGWGAIEANESLEKINIIIKHSELLKGDGGYGYAYFLAGYVESVLSGILHDISKNIEFQKPITKREKLIEFHLSKE